MDRRRALDTDADTDLLIIGAGPTGLFAAYYAGFRGLRVAVVDSLPELGGQITAMYPEKAILDVAGFPNVKGRDLVDGLVEQASPRTRTYHLDRTALDAGARRRLGHHRPRRRHRDHRRRASSSPPGIGKFSPRPLPAGEGWLGRGMEFFVPSFAPYAGKDVVIVGGGDSAFDWAAPPRAGGARRSPWSTAATRSGPTSARSTPSASSASRSSPRPQVTRAAR